MHNYLQVAMTLAKAVNCQGLGKVQVGKLQSSAQSFRTVTTTLLIVTTTSFLMINHCTASSRDLTKSAVFDIDIPGYFVGREAGTCVTE